VKAIHRPRSKASQISGWYVATGRESLLKSVGALVIVLADARLDATRRIEVQQQLSAKAEQISGLDEVGSVCHGYTPAETAGSSGESLGQSGR